MIARPGNWVVFVDAETKRSIIAGVIQEVHAVGDVHAVRVLRPGVAGSVWWPVRCVRRATWLEVIAGELALMVRGIPGSL